MILVARRFTSHSKGPRMVSSKSLMSKTSRPSGAAYAPRFRTWASPHSWVKMPVWGSTARSAAMIGTAPRKKPNGESAIRCHLIVSRAGTRPTAETARASMGSVWRSAERHRFCSWRRTCLRRDCPKARRSGGGSTCLRGISYFSRRGGFQQVLHLHVNRVRPTETHHVLIAGDQLHIRRPGFDVVLLMDGPFLLETGSDSMGELLGNPACIVGVPIGPQTANGKPVERGPAKGQIPLQAARVGAAGEAAGPVQQSKILVHRCCLFRRSQACPERIEGRRVNVAGLLPRGEVVIEKHPFARVPQVLVDRLAASVSHLHPTRPICTLVDHFGKFGQVLFVVVEQAVEADSGVMVGGTAEGTEAETNIETRLPYRAVTLIEVATKAKAVGPGQAANDGVGRIATGFRKHRLLCPGRGFRRSDQVVGVHIVMSHQPVDHVYVVVAVVGDVRYRALADIKIPRQPGLPGAVNATQPEIVIAARIRVSTSQPLLLPGQIRRRPVAGTCRFEDGPNHCA